MIARLCRRECGELILLARKAEDTKKWTVLDAEPVDAYKVADASQIRILEGSYAYRLDHMRESLEMRSLLQPDQGPAEDFPWHPIHHCKEN